MRSGLRLHLRPFCLAAVAATAIGAAGTPTALAAAPPAQSGNVTITGTVTDGTTGAGVGGMCVYATWFIPPHYADTVGPSSTVADGTYSISMPFNDGVEASIFIAAYPGWGSGPNWQNTTYPNEFGVTSPSTTTGIDMTTFPAGNVRGRVTDAQTGAPIANARLDALALTPGARSSETWTKS